MKIYSNVFDLAFPSPNRFWVAPNSDFKIGIKIENKGQSYAGAFALKVNGETLSPDEDKTAGFTTYTLKSGGPGSVIYTVDVPDAQQKFTLVQVVTDSTVFDVGSGGGDVPADVATQSWVESQISDFVEEDALTAYATKNDLTSKADVSSLADYAEASALNNVSLSVDGALAAIADINENQIPGINSTLGMCVTHQPYGEAPEVFQITTAYESEWETLSAETDKYTLYVVLPDPA